MNHTESAYGLWSLVIINSAIFIMFAFSFFKPATARDWRTFGAFAAFIVALFVEMYGFPLTIYLISGWLQTKFPNLDLLSHTSGHLWSTLLGEKGDPHFGVLHIASYVFLGFGFYLLSTAWNVLYHAQRGQSLATTGPYAQCRSVKSERHFFDGILGLGHTNLTRIPPVGSARRQHEAADVLSHGRKLGRDGPRGV